MLIGYARVSTEDQKLSLQRDALLDTGCERIFEEKLSAAHGPMPEREEMLRFARRGDVVVVWKLDRLGRTLRDLVDLVAVLGGWARNRTPFAPRVHRHHDAGGQAHLSRLRSPREDGGRPHAREDPSRTRGGTATWNKARSPALAFARAG